MQPDPDLARRLTLVEHILRQWYPTWAGAWLKAVPASDVEAPPEAGTRELVQVFLEEHFNLWTPEDAPYGTFVTGTWRAIDRQAMLDLVDRLLAEAHAQIVEYEAKEAAERSQAAAGGWLAALGPPALTDLTIDCEALRRWFTAELWGDAEPTWFTNTGPGVRDEPAVIGIDDHVIAILWLPRGPAAATPSG